MCIRDSYYTDTFQDKSGVYAEEVSLPDLTAVTAWFAENLAEMADQVPRDENGLFDVSLDEIFADSTTIYPVSYTHLDVYKRQTQR